ncbi:uncharacterized protein [Asterias amurensis]|uniref:uncharacterized protein isoform X3 n=1 Tax=Asterias amurensis TaxID=7602 RepID=UPI003AB1706D
MATWYQSLASQSRQTAAHVWQPRNTSSVIFSKGLLNAPGENNCFLNSAVQVLWHLDVFRRSFREMGGHACMGNACIFCALKVLFTQLRYSDRQSLPPDALRRALAVAFKDELRFQLGCMDDAAECFENILSRIHFHLAHETKEELCDAKHCIPHRKFAMTLIEHSVCSCGATSEPFPFTQMVHYVSCTALCAEAKKIKQKYKWSNSVCFGQVLRNAGAIGDIRACPSECGKKINIRRVLMNSPDVVAIGLVWDSDRPEKDHIVDVIQCLGTSLRMPDLFNSVVDDSAKQAALHLVGVVTYYGKHYSTFFYNTAHRQWVYFDDATVKRVGPNWRDVVNRCKRGHSQPLLLLFANPNGTPVSPETAPRESTLLPGYTDTKSPAAVPSSGNPLQSVFEYEPDKERPEKNHGSNHVVEIGHDALRIMQSKYSGGKSINQSSQSQGTQTGRLNMQETKEFPSQRYEDIKPEFSYPAKPDNKLPVKSKSATPFLYKTVGNGTSRADETGGNMPLSRSRGQPISHLACFDSSYAKNKPANTGKKPYISSDLCQRYTPTSHVTHPRKLERHESWSGRSSQQACYDPRYSQSRHSISINRQNSFNDAAMSSSHRYSSVPDLQQGYDQLHHRMLRCQSAVDYSKSHLMSHGCLQEGNKSLSVQSIPMATEGILASAIKNQAQQKTTHSLSSDTSMRANSNMQDPAVCGSLAGMFYDSTHSVVSTQLDEHLTQSTTQQTNGQKSASALESPAYGQLSKVSLYMEQELEKMNQTKKILNEKEIQQNSTFQEHIPKCSPMKSLRNRDSIASRDSGYRSRDRSSASSIEAPHVKDTEEKMARHSGFHKAHDLTLHPASDENMTPNINSVCEKLLAEVVGLQTQSRKMENDGDLATALALCTSVVTKLKGGRNLEGISSQTHQVLHKEYNNAVLQSRNLERRLHLLRRPSQAGRHSRDENLIDFHGTVHRVDRLKQQLQELYIHKGTRQEDFAAPLRTETTTLAGTNYVKAWDEDSCKRTVLPNSMSVGSNRNQNACNDSCMFTDCQSKAKEKLLMKPTYQSNEVMKTQDQNWTDPCHQRTTNVHQTHELKRHSEELQSALYSTYV